MKKVYVSAVILAALFLLILYVFFVPSTETGKVNVLVAAPFTGEAASYGKLVKEGIEIALDELGNDPVKAKINIIYRDSKLSLQEIANIFNQELSLHPLAVVMPVSTSEALALAPLCDRNKVVLLPPLADGDQLSGISAYFFRISPASSFQGRELARAVIHAGHKQPAILYLNDAWGEGLSSEFRTSFDSTGRRVVAMESCNPGQNDVRAQLVKIKDAKPDAIIILVHPAETIPALRQIRELGLKVQMYGGDTFSNKAIYKEAAELAQGVIFALPTTPDNEIFTKFSSLYKAKYGTEADINAAAARDAMILISEAVRSGAKDGQSIAAFFASMKNGFNGVTGVVLWNSHGDVISKSYSLYIIKGDSYLPYEQN